MDKEQINCNAFVETKNDANTNVNYKDWTIVTHKGNIINKNIRGGSLFQFHPGTSMRKENAPKINDPRNDALHISIPFMEDRLHILLVYVHNNAPIENSILIKCKLYKYVILLGDFNPNYSKRKQITNFIQTSNFTQIITPPTFLMANNRDTTPDLIFCTQNITNAITKLELIPDLGSDHLSIILSINTINPIISATTKTPNFNKSDIAKINTEMNLLLDTFSTSFMNQELITTFNEGFSTIIQSNTPKQNKNFFIQQLPPFIVQQIKLKRKLYREYQINKSNVFKMKINTFNNNIKKMIIQFKTHTWIKACNEIAMTKGRNYWHIVKRLSKYNLLQDMSNLKANGIHLTENADKAEAFAEHFAKIYAKTNDLHFNEQFYQEVNNWYDRFFTIPNEADEELENVTVEEISSILKKCKNTSPGIDNIPIGIIKQMDRRILHFIANAFNFCLTTAYFPELWKKGTIVTLPKPNQDHSAVENYRPITLLSSIGKLFEKTIKYRIEKHIGHTIPDFQFGFRDGKSTLHPLTILTSNTEASKISNTKTAALFLDIAKAFDSVWHNGLLYKLNILHCPRYLINIIKGFLETRSLQIKIGTSLSSTFSPEQGVPQGSPLSPLLYSIYSYDMCSEHDQTQYALQFADDTVLIAHQNTLTKTTAALQISVNNITTWFNKWRLKPNPDKSQLLIFNHRISQKSPKIIMSGVEIKPKQQVKYLGVHLDHKLNFNQHLQKSKSKLLCRASHFRSITFKDKEIRSKHITKIYKSICRPIIEYGHPIFSNCKETALNKIKTAETCAIRRLSRIRNPNNPLHNPRNTSLYEQTGITPISTRLKLLTKQFASTQITNLEPLCIKPSTNSRYKPKFPTRTTFQILQDISLLDNNLRETS